MALHKPHFANTLKRKVQWAFTLTLALLFMTTVALQGLGGGRVAAEPWPDTAPAQICGDEELLSGPSSAPEGAVTVPDGDNSSFNFNQTNTTFWFEPGTHTLANDIYGQIVTHDGNTYIGAPGAVIDGQNINLYAFTDNSEDVTIKYLTIQDFGSGMDNNNEGVVNHDAGSGWTVEYNTITHNDGAGVFLGSDNVVRYNCLKDNGQYGFSMYKDPVEGDSAIKNIVLDHNEIAGNNQDNWENEIEGCGCTGGGKFWDVNGATVTNNWVHHNKSTGLWADTNNIDFLFEGNWIENNEGEGIWYEISYNATIRNNVIRQNAWVSGQSNTGSPGAAVYLSESAGDSRLDYTVSGAAQIRIYDNLFDNNFSGVSIYENANRFCNSNGNTSKGYCTPFVSPNIIAEPHDYEYPNPIDTDHLCYTDVDQAPYTTDCRWHSKNIEVYQNDFIFDDEVVPCAGDYCGAQALYATGADNMTWSPYTVSGVQNDVMFNNNNTFHDNTYVGNWRFAKGYGETISFANWQAAPYNQDADSTIEGNEDPGEGGGGTTGTPAGNDLDADTSGLEGSIGEWQGWYSADVTQSAEQAHSGTKSLRVDITDPWGWGVELANWPGFEAGHGVKTLSFWGRLGSGTGLEPKMTVKWLDESYNVLDTESVTLPTLTTAWQKVTAVTDAPVGTATALVYLEGETGDDGDYFYLDDMVVGAAANVLNADSGGAESSAGEWVSWYSAGVSTTASGVFRGSGSLLVTVTDPWGWAVETGNWPGFDATAGDKRLSFWAKQGTGDISDVTLDVAWVDSANQTISTSSLPLESLTTSWQQAMANVTAPAGTASAHFTLSSNSGEADETLLIDDIVLTNR